MDNICFKFNKEKAIEVILYLANKKAGTIDAITLNKMLFYADEYHLNKYGRPIFGGYYVAMHYGPVPSQIRDLINNKENKKAFSKNEYFIVANREANLEYLSKSDIEALDKSFEICKDISPMNLSDKSHLHKAWKNAWDKHTFYCKSPKIDYSDMIENQDIITSLQSISKIMVF